MSERTRQDFFPVWTLAVEAADAARGWTADRTWSVVAAPLLEFAAKPWRDSHRERFSELAPGAVTGEEPLLQRLQRALRRKRRAR